MTIRSPRCIASYAPALLLLAVLGWSACTPKVADVVSQECPPPVVPKCAPGSFTEVTLDTMFHGTGTVQRRIIVVPAPASSPARDFAISYLNLNGRSVELVTSDRSSANGNGTGRETLWAYDARTGRALQVLGLDSTGPVGAACYSTADARLYFAAHGKKDDPDDFDLYSARVQLLGDELHFSDIRALEEVNARNMFDSQPAIDPSGTTLVFASDRPGGVGGTDLWLSRRSGVGAKWSEPVSIAGPVNSECDELSPSFGSDGKLYFASNGHRTAGGYDLFASSYRNEAFSSPDNIGLPINTQYDELFPVRVADSALYWSSDRPVGPTARNIFTITDSRIPGFATKVEVPQEKPRIEHIDSLPTGPVDLYVDVTRGEGKPAAGADLFLRRDSVEIYRAKAPASGKFKIKLNRDVYDVGAETAESFFEVKRIDLRTDPDSTAHLSLNLPDTLVLRINFPFDDHEHPYEFVIGDDGIATTMTWSRALDLTAQSTLRSVQSLKKLILIGHTDSLGSDAYNARLGQQRAEFVASELIRRGVPKRLITVRSRGRTEPVAIRPGETDEQFRLRSRRVEFVKVF